MGAFDLSGTWAIKYLTGDVESPKGRKNLNKEDL
jgi:hypothetical protein